MFRKSLVAALVVALVSFGAAAQDAKTAISNASKAMGADNVSSITYSGSALNVNFGQTRSATGPWPPVTITNYTRAIDLAQPASRATGAIGTPAITGGPPAATTYNQNITPANTAWAQQLEIWITPWGFLKGAAANNATARAQRVAGRNNTVVSWSPSQKSPSGAAYTVTGYINDQNLVERVETWVEHAIFGDLHVEATYSNYQDFSGLKVPGRIVQKRAGTQTFEATVTAASANPANIAELLQPPAPPGGQRGGAPAAGRGGAPGGAPAAAQSEKIADGVYRVTGNYSALVVDFKDHIVVLEAGQNEARGLAILAEAKRLVPNKPIQYVVNTHPHFDHANGLAPFVAEGTTIVTHENNKALFEKAFSGPRTLLGDTLAKANRKPRVDSVSDKKVLSDGTHTIELHHIKDLEHSDGMIVAFFPKEKILFTADFTLPQPGQPASPFVVTLAQNVERLKLDFERFLPVHPPNPDAPLTRADLMKAVGKD